MAPVSRIDERSTSAFVSWRVGARGLRARAAAACGGLRKLAILGPGMEGSAGGRIRTAPIWPWFVAYCYFVGAFYV